MSGVFRDRHIALLELEHLEATRPEFRERYLRNIKELERERQAYSLAKDIGMEENPFNISRKVASTFGRLRRNLLLSEELLKTAREDWYTDWQQELDSPGRSRAGVRLKRAGDAREAANLAMAEFIQQHPELPEKYQDFAKSVERNPESTAAELYEEFHGKPPSEIKEVVEERHEHEWLTQLGVLVELKVATVTQLDASLKFTKDPPDLCSSEDGRQLYIVGGDQELDLGALKMGGEKWLKDSMTLGILVELTYRTQKGFQKFKLTDYYHKLGEETGVQPFLLYDPNNKALSISGGQYETKPEGIVN